VEFKLTTLVVIGTDCTGSYKSNYHAIMTMTATQYILKVLFMSNTVYLHKNKNRFLPLNEEIIIAMPVSIKTEKKKNNMQK
jgi:ABC-type uncharacterized transport system YnjBCD ATPase subunit